MNDAQRGIPLHRLADQRQLLDSELAISDGVLTTEQEKRFDAIARESDRAIYRQGVRICQEAVMCTAIDREVQRLQERKRVFANRIARRKERLREHMERLGKEKVEGPLCTVTLRRNAVAVQATASTSSGPQRDLFSRSRAPHQSRTARGNHIRVR